MSRTRMIKPQFFKHAELFEAERESGLPLRVAFAGLWTVTDKAGRFRWKVDLKPDVLPYDNVDMMAVLAALETFGFVRSYVVDGKRYGFIPSFKDHQTFHKTERGSTLPPPVEEPPINGGSPVRHMADTGTVTGTVTEKELVADATRRSARAVRPARPSSPAASPSPPAPPRDNWVGRLVDLWQGEVGRIAPGRLGEQLKASVTTHGVATIDRAMRSFIHAQKSAGKSCSFAFFVAEVEVWVERASTPLEVIGGEMNAALELATRPGRLG